MPSAHESKEFADFLEWKSKSKHQLLKASNCIAAWTDVCGFGNMLQNNNWDLTRLQKNGVVKLLNDVHSIAGRPLLTNPDPYPSDKIIILNDGVARTVDLFHKDKLDAYLFLFYLRDLIFTHYFLLPITKSYNGGIRTILAGGERIQYSPEVITGHSILSYNNDKISESGQSLLNTTFVYNPAEFQMNTAFAKAFTIDSLGTKHSIKINGLYIEKDFINQIRGIGGLGIRLEKKQIKFYYKSTLVFRLSIAETLEFNMKGLNVVVFHINKFFIYKEFDGDDVEIDLFMEHEQPTNIPSR